MGRDFAPKLRSKKPKKAQILILELAVSIDSALLVDRFGGESCDFLFGSAMKKTVAAVLASMAAAGGATFLSCSPSSEQPEEFPQPSNLRQVPKVSIFPVFVRSVLVLCFSLFLFLVGGVEGFFFCFCFFWFRCYDSECRS